MFSDPDVTPPEEADERLRREGLSVAVLHSVLRQGQQAYYQTTANHPPTAPGWYRWSEANRAARDELAPSGWKRCNDEGIPRTVSPDGSCGFTVTLGNEDTGLAHRLPSTLRPRGGASQRDIVDNLQTDMFRSNESTIVQRKNWFLLFHYYELDDRAYTRCEFSLPARVDENGSVVMWAERIILPTIDLTESPEPRRPEEYAAEIDIPVNRRDAKG